MNMSDDRDLSISFEANRPGLGLMASLLVDYRHTQSPSDFASFESKIFAKIRQERSLDSLKDDPILGLYREFYWTFGMDPTKFRVSSEALIRRILNGHNLWRISSLVDVVNLASAYHAIPIGLVDMDRVKGQLRVRIAKKGETFHRIGGKTLTCRGREIVLADDEKIVCFGYATHDSAFTMVRSESRNVLIILYGAPGISIETLQSAMDLTLTWTKKWVVGRPGPPLFFHS